MGRRIFGRKKMIDLSYLKYNIISNRWRERYDKCPKEVKEKLDQLGNMFINEYQLKVIKRKRIYPEIGDVFMVCPRDNIEYYGVVVNNHVNNNNGNDLIVIFIFKSGVDIAQAIKNGVKKEDLLIEPEIVGKEYWTRGYFYNVGHTSEMREKRYGFYSIGKQKFFDEYGNDIHEEPYLLGTYGVSTISGIAYGINKELIISGLI
ncbi:MAG: hypothetical protein K6G60_06470 [Lachnospiraceae bacterium]|nr:hypothetical protein [Lachnospiraceae bacterium]